MTLLHNDTEFKPLIIHSFQVKSICKQQCTVKFAPSLLQLMHLLIAFNIECFTNDRNAEALPVSTPTTHTDSMDELPSLPFYSTQLKN